jgi:hypothetical protein
MAESDPLTRIAWLIERQLALDLHFRGTSKEAIAKLLQKRKAWVVDLLEDIPKGK